MASYNELLALIDAYINQNGVQAITGQVLNGVLRAMVDQLGRGYSIMGAADPTTDPGTPDGPETWFASVPGTYTNFDGIQIVDGELALLSYEPSTGFSKNTIYEGFQTVQATIDGNVGTPAVGVSYANGILSFDFHNMKGVTGDPAGFGAVTASVDSNIGTPSVQVQTSGPDTAKAIAFQFHNLKGETGVTSVLATVDNTSGNPQCAVSLNGQQLVLNFTGLKGAQGDTGSSVDYPFTIVNNLTTNDPAQALSAAMGVQLESEVSQLEAKVTDLELFEGATMSNFRTRKDTVSGALFSYNNYITGLDIAQGQEIHLRVDSSAYTRLVINYNGSNSQRLIDRTADYRGQWLTVVAPVAITQIGIYVEGLTIGTDVILSVQYGNFFLPEKSVGPGKIADRAVGYTNFDTSARDKILPTIKSANLYDERERIDGKYLNNSGVVASATGWAMSPLIPVTAGNKYTISCRTSARNVGFRWCDANGDKLSTDGSIFTTHTAPTGAVYMQFNVAASGSYSTDIMVVEGATALPFVPYLQTESMYIKDFAEDVLGVAGSGKLTITKNGNTLTVANPDGAITAKMENNSGAVYTANPVFNFTGFSFSGLSNTGADDIAPMHILNTTIGANHGQPCKRATITAHGLDNTAIGTGWTKDGVTFYVMRIYDADNIVFLSENSGTLASPSFTALTAGTIERNGNTLTVESVTDSQLVPALKNHTLKLMLNGDKEITADGVYSSKTLDVVEEYDIMNPVSTLQKIIARAGQSADPEYDGDSAIRVKNIYRFNEGLAVLVITTVIPMQEVKLSDIMFTQAAQIKSGNKNYIPNSLPLGNGNYDFRKPLSVTWSSSVPSLAVTEDKMADMNNPVNRVIQYNETYGVGFALGFLRGFGVGKDLLSYTGTTFEIRNNTGKIYPHGVTSAKVGGTIDQDNIYQAVMYRSPFVFTSLSSGRMSMYHFAFDGAEYVFLDYASTMVDNVLVDASLNGKTIEVIEAVNAELVSDIYNDGFLVNATYVEGETCYLVAKIK